ncbi:DUF1990 family protein [Nitriliruptor alkaliphilus]|uniref:DUF1990 family protein n=1 Tax=Nitriliruptor alkaliphilus TaxID=427918 RepID=UPI00146FFEBA|nr:DUF1990 family protein [Nitriliruptor alkaliphilus]
MSGPDSTAVPAEQPSGQPTQHRVEGRWAAPRDRLQVEGEVGAAAVDGRRVSGPVQGFGRLWQKTFRVRLDDVEITPAEVMATWRERYGEFWPTGNEFRSPLAGVEPGEIGIITGRVGGLRLSTGVLVMYADETSFAFITPEGHPFAGLITFSADRDDDGTTAAQVELFLRAHDPIVELGLAFGLHRKEETIWTDTCGNLARALGVLQPTVDSRVVCVDRRRQWRRIGNLRHDAVLSALIRPFRR